MDGWIFHEGTAQGPYAGNVHRYEKKIIHIAPGVVGRTRFNIGVPKRGGWFAWVATGGSIYRVDNAGQLEFVK